MALVTGGASGIGEATSRVLAGAGAKVIVADLNGAAAGKLAAEIGGEAMVLDVADEGSVKAGFAGVAKLDVLVNNAGIGLVGSVAETELADFQRVFRVNVEGVFLVTKYALPLLLASGRGAIVNLGSVGGLVGVKRRYAYCGTKGAIVAMTKQLAVDYPTELRTNCICPGTVETPFVEGYLEKYHSHEKDEVRKQLNARQPVGRLGKPEEIAHLVLYLASDEAGFVNGSIVSIDGGWSAA